MYGHLFIGYYKDFARILSENSWNAVFPNGFVVAKDSAYTKNLCVVTWAVLLAVFICVPVWRCSFNQKTKRF